MCNFAFVNAAVGRIVMHPKNISIKEFNYYLPEDKIPQYPVAQRDTSRLLVYNMGKLAEDLYNNIDTHLPQNSLLIFNDTKVIEARLLFQKPTGGIVEIFCLEAGDQYPDILSAMLKREKVIWKCLVGGASKWKRGQILEKHLEAPGKQIKLSARYIDKITDYFIIELSWSENQMNFGELLQLAGSIPLPPYIKRNSEAGDVERYQTVYANYGGSVAAPTAGLHFTPAIFDKLNKKKIQTGFVTLHVGAGTFKPVKTATLQDHGMHAEWINVSIETIEQIAANLDNCIVAVGTTSLRTIESIYWFGVKIETGNLNAGLENSSHVIELDQWEAYDLANYKIAPAIALHSLVAWMRKNNLQRLVAKTRILIAPGYVAKIAKGLITNFHQPGSTLLLLVAALIGDDWQKVYTHALENQFRFLSYGDGSLLWIPSSAPTAGGL